MRTKDTSTLDVQYNEVVRCVREKGRGKGTCNCEGTEKTEERTKPSVDPSILNPCAS